MVYNEDITHYRPALSKMTQELLINVHLTLLSNQCIIQTKYKQMERVWTVTRTETSTTSTMAKNTQHLSIRWSQPLCVSSYIQQQPNALY